MKKFTVFLCTLMLLIGGIAAQANATAFYYADIKSALLFEADGVLDFTLLDPTFAPTVSSEGNSEAFAVDPFADLGTLPNGVVAAAQVSGYAVGGGSEASSSALNLAPFTLSNTTGDDISVNFTLLYSWQIFGDVDHLLESASAGVILSLFLDGAPLPVLTEEATAPPDFNLHSGDDQNWNVAEPLGPFVIQDGTTWNITLGVLAHGNAVGVPEPATMLLVGSGLVGLAGLGRKRFFKKP